MSMQNWTCYEIDDYSKVQTQSPLLKAIRTEDLFQIEKCINEGNWGTNEIQRDYRGAEIYPLELASELGDLETVKTLIRCHADPNNGNCNTPLIISIQKKHFEITKYLIEKGANACKLDLNSKSPLYWAVINNDMNVIRLLLDNGAEFTIMSALPEALRKREPSILQLLLEKSTIKNFPLNEPDKNGDTILLQSVRKENFPIVNFLAGQENINVNYINPKNNKTALELALINSDFRTFKLLISKGADIRLAATAIVEMTKKSPEFAAYMKTIVLKRDNKAILKGDEEHPMDK